MNKRFKTYETKSAINGIKDLDLNSREVAFYLSRFDVIDSDNDMIKRGAFKKSLKENGVGSDSNRTIKFLRYHDWEHQIGTFTRLEEDETGLFAVGKLGKSTKGEDALRDYEDGIITEHSIGFQYIEDKIKFVEDSEMKSGGFFQINEVKLWEGSAVTFGANEHTGVIGVAKSLDEKISMMDRLTNEINLIVKSLVNGKGSDERLHELEMKLKFLNAQLIEVANTNPVMKDQFAVESKSNAFDWNKVNDFFEIKQTFADYPKQAIANAEKGIRLNDEVGNVCATAVGKQRARDIVAGRGFSLDVLKRVYAYLSRAKTYYNANDEKACGTISYLLWGGEAMRVWSEKKLNELEN